MRLFTASLNKNTTIDLEPETSLYISGESLSQDAILKVDNLVKGLKSSLSISNLSDAFDVIHIYSSYNSSIALKNLVKDSNHATLSATAPTFTQYKGFKGNKLSAYIDSNYNPFTDKVNYSLDSASIGIYLNSIDQSGEIAHMVWGAREGNVNYSQLMPFRMGGSPQRYINAELASLGASLRTGKVDKTLYVMNRISSIESEQYMNGRLDITEILQSSNIPNVGNISILSSNVDGTKGILPTDAEVGLWFVGRGFTASEQYTINDEFEKYMVSVNNKNQVKITEPFLIWTFDDSRYEHGLLTGNTRELFKSKTNADGSIVRCTHFTMTQDAIDEVAGSMNTQQVIDLYNEGFDIQCHTDTFGWLNDLTEAEVLAKLDLVDSFFTDNGMIKPTITAYPGGGWSINAKSALSKRRLFGRYIGHNKVITHGYIKEQYGIDSSVSTDGMDAQANIDVLNNVIDDAITQNGAAIFYGHGVYNIDPSESEYPNPMKLSVIEGALDYAISKGIKIKTMKDIFNLD